METIKLYTEAIEIQVLSAIVTKKAMYALQHHPDLASAGIGCLQYKILRALGFGEQTISELSRKLMLDPSTLVPAVDALERKGLVRRGKDPHDRRRVPLALTERGTKFLECFPLTDDRNPVLKSLQAMGDEQSHQLRALLRELVRHMPGGEEILTKVSYRVRAQTTNALAPPDTVNEK